MLNVALTGGIATGKTYVLRKLAAMGVPTIDADQLARLAVRPDTPGWEAVRARFGDRMLTPSGEIDRRKLGDLVFADAEARGDLEAIVHPLVRRDIEAWQAARAREARHLFIVADIPLLFEGGRALNFDRVIVTMCGEDLQVRRIVERDGLSEADARGRLAAQMPVMEKARRADYVIDTSGTFAETDRQVAFVAGELGKLSRG